MFNFSGLSDTTREVQQIDLVPTLAILLGLPVPQNNLGIIMETIVKAWPVRDQLKAMHINAQQMLSIFKENVPHYQKGE